MSEDATGLLMVWMDDEADTVLDTLCLIQTRPRHSRTLSIGVGTNHRSMPGFGRRLPLLRENRLTGALVLYLFTVQYNEWALSALTECGA